MPKIYTEAEKQEHKNILYEKGLAFFYEQGYKNINIDKMVGLIGVSKGYFYLLFDSKEEFFLGALLWHMNNNYKKLYELKENGTKTSELIKIYLEDTANAPYARITDYVTVYQKIDPKLLKDFMKPREDYYRKLLMIFEKDSSIENAHILANMVLDIHFSKLVNLKTNIGFSDAADKTLQLLLQATEDFIKKLPTDKKSYKELKAE
ncbi:MAG: TetR/AcrR family transcriptional regulator [Firmicutes bacterium]|nr:TetR/AcrR family transcriptional regulator [Bacillota bacterium]